MEDVMSASISEAVIRKTELKQRLVMQKAL